MYASIRAYILQCHTQIYVELLDTNNRETIRSMSYLLQLFFWQLCLQELLWNLYRSTMLPHGHCMPAPLNKLFS